MPDGDQAHRSRHHKVFSSPVPPMLFLPTTPNGCASGGRPPAFLLTPGAASFRARKQERDGSRPRLVSRPRRDPRTPGPIRVPTLYIWGDADDTVGRIAAEGTADFIAAPYRFEVLSASAISPPTRCPIASTRYCFSTLRPIRFDRSSARCGIARASRSRRMRHLRHHPRPARFRSSRHRPSYSYLKWRNPSRRKPSPQKCSNCRGEGVQRGPAQKEVLPMEETIPFLNSPLKR
jgi:hypothetical protein